MSNSKEVSNSGKESIEATLSKIAALLGDTAKKDDIDGLKSQIQTFTVETNEEISKLKTAVHTVQSKAIDQQHQLSLLQTNIEILKQDQLRNNVSIAGIPGDLVDNSNSDDVIINIAAKIGIELSKSHFTSHTVANNRFVIAHFYNLKYKLMIINQLRMGKRLIVKEVFANAASNSQQIFINDHLTPYFNKLYLIARNAKREGKLHSVSSYNGKIRVRKHSDDSPIVINDESQLELLINFESADSVDISSNKSQFVEEANNASTSTRKSESINTKANRSNKPHNQTSKRRRIKSPNKSEDTNNNKKRTKPVASNSSVAST